MSTSDRPRISNILKIGKLPRGATETDVRNSLGRWSSKIKSIDIVDDDTTAIVALQTARDAAQITTDFIDIKGQPCGLLKITNSGDEPSRESEDNNSLQPDSGHDYRSGQASKGCVQNTAAGGVPTSLSVTTERQDGLSINRNGHLYPAQSSPATKSQSSITDPRSYQSSGTIKGSTNPDPLHGQAGGTIHEASPYGEAHNINQQQHVIQSRDSYSPQGHIMLENPRDTRLAPPGMEERYYTDTGGYPPFMNVGSNNSVNQHGYSVSHTHQSADPAGAQWAAQSYFQNSPEQIRFMNSNHHNQIAMGLPMINNQGHPSQRMIRPPALGISSTGYSYNAMPNIGYQMPEQFRGARGNLYSSYLPGTVTLGNVNLPVTNLEPQFGENFGNQRLVVNQTRNDNFNRPVETTPEVLTNPESHDMGRTNPNLTGKADLAPSSPEPMSETGHHVPPTGLGDGKQTPDTLMTSSGFIQSNRPELGDFSANNKQTVIPGEPQTFGGSIMSNRLGSNSQQFGPQGHFPGPLHPAAQQMRFPPADYYVQDPTSLQAFWPTYQASMYSSHSHPVDSGTGLTDQRLGSTTNSSIGSGLWQNINHGPPTVPITPTAGDPVMSGLSQPCIAKQVAQKIVSDSDLRLLRSTSEPYGINGIFIDNYEGVLYYIFKDQKGLQDFLSKPKSTMVSEATLNELDMSYYLDRLLISGCHSENEDVFHMFIEKAHFIGLSLTLKKQGSNPATAVFLLEEGFSSVVSMATFIEACLELVQHHFVVAPVKKTNFLKVKCHKYLNELKLSRAIDHILNRQAVRDIRKIDDENAAIVDMDRESSQMESELKGLFVDNQKYEVDVYYPCLYKKAERPCFCSGTSNRQSHSHVFSRDSSNGGIVDSHSPRQDSQHASKSPKSYQPKFKVRESYKKQKLIVLETCSIIQELEKKYPDVKIEIESENGFVTITAGQEDHGEMVRMKLEMHMTKNVAQINITKFSPEQMEVIKCEGFLNKLSKDFRETHEIPACVDISGNTVNITYEKGKQEKADIEDIVTSAVSVEEFKLQPHEIVMFQSEQWKAKVKSMAKKNPEFKFCHCQVKESKLMVIGPPTVQYKIQEVMNKFTASAPTDSLEIHFDDKEYRFAAKYLRDELQVIKDNVKGLGADMSWKRNNCHLEGLKDGVDRGQDELKKLKSRISVTSKQLECPCAVEYLFSEAGAEEIRKTEKKHSCIITVGSSSDDYDKEKETIGQHSSTLRNRYVLGALVVSITEGDLSQARADVIVNTVIKQDASSNTVQIVSSDLDLDEDTIADLEDSVRVDGEVVTLNVGRGKQSKMVNHLFFSKSINTDDLWKHIKKVMTKIDEKEKCEVVALSLEMGALGSMKKKDKNSVKHLVKILVDELQSCSNIRTLSLHGKNEESITTADRYLQELMPNGSKGSKVTTRGAIANKASNQKGAKQKNANIFSSNLKKTFGSITVKIQEGDITKAKTDVIVSSVHSSLDMTRGMIIQTIRKDGGPKIEQELKSKYPKGIKEGEFAKVNGGNLKCKQLFLCCLSQWDKNTSPLKIQNMVVDVLKEANTQKMTSVSLPAFGTGNLNYNPGITCSSVLSGVEEFVRVTSQPFTTKVKLVLFHKDLHVLQAYKSTFAEQSTLAGRSTFAGQSTFSAGTLLETRGTLDFGNINVKVTSGDIIAQETEATVISISKDLNLKNGKVAQLVLQKGGQTIQDQLNQKYPKGLSYYEMGYTSGGNLRCDHLFHAVIPGWANLDVNKMVKLLEDILRDVDAKKAQSVSLPAFGTGNLEYPPERTIEITLQSISNFAKTKPKFLETVQLVVHPSDAGVKKAFDQGLLNKTAIAQPDTGTQSLEVEKPVEKPSQGWFGGIVSYLANMFGGSSTTEADAANAYHVDFNTVRMFIKHGDIAYERCDALVIGMREDMDILHSGAVCAHIARCYPELARLRRECVSDLRHSGLTYTAVSGTSDLHCNRIYCLSIDLYHENWSRGVENVLMKAEKDRLESVCFPLLGATVPGVDLNEVTKKIVDGVHQFSSQRPKCVRDVRIVIYEKHLFQELVTTSQASVHPMSRLSSVDAYIQRDVSEKAVVYFCHEHKKDIGNVINEFFDQCNNKFKTNDHKSGNVKDFSDEQIRALVETGRKHCYKVVVNTNTGRVRMSGFGDVSKVHKKIGKIEAEVEKMKKQQLADSMNTEMRWEYIWEDTRKDFSNVANFELEANFKNKKIDCNVDIDDDKYIVNFKTMKARNVDSGTILKVERRNRWESGEPLPGHWEPMDDSQEPKLIDLDPQSQEYKDVEEHFKSKGATGTIQKIQRVQNRALYQQYTAKEREIRSRNPPGHENEMRLFHGSDINAVDAINRTGFNRSYCGKNATVYGLGVYFAESAAYSETYANPDDNNERKLYQARVLVGMAVQTDNTTKYLPMQPGKNVPYDSGKAPPTRTEGIHIIFHDSQAYPEFLITFTLPLDTPKA